MQNTRPVTLALAAGFAALVAVNWDLIVQTHRIRIFDAGTWLSLCF